MALILLSLSGLFYLLVFVLHGSAFATMWERGHKLASVFLRIGFFLGTFYFAAEASRQGFFLPIAGLSQAMAFLAWAIAFVYLVLLGSVHDDSFEWILAPILALFTALAAFSFFETPKVPAELMMHPYFILHIFSAFFAYASFTLSFSAALLYLIQYHGLKYKHQGELYRRLPPLEVLEKLIYVPILWGVPLLGIAAGIGLIWSKSVYGEFWLWDPKTITILGTLFLYGFILYRYYVSEVHGKKIALWSAVAFSFVIFSLIGTRFLDGQHKFWP